MIKINTAKNFTDGEKRILDNVLVKANKTYSDRMFWNAVALQNFTYTNDTGQIVANRMKDIDIYVDIYLYDLPWWKFLSSEIAIEKNGSIGINRKYFDHAGFGELSGTLFHECAHKMGYTHPWANTPTRPMSVPYRLGEMARFWPAVV